MNITVYDLRTGAPAAHFSGITPAEAVRNAYAILDCGDYNTADYAARYNHLIVDGATTVACGDYCAFKTIAIVNSQQVVYTMNNRVAYVDPHVKEG